MSKFHWAGPRRLCRRLPTGADPTDFVGDRDLQPGSPTKSLTKQFYRTDALPDAEVAQPTVPMH